MARLRRVSPIGVPVHVIQRGNAKQDCFKDDEDREKYLSIFSDAKDKYKVDVHAWVLMSNHVHFLCTPLMENALSQMMQSVGRFYVRYFNKKYDRTGTLWEGRFKSCLVDSELYVLELYRYIELNPVRAGMVEDVVDYRWSSYSVNRLGNVDNFIKHHDCYLSLADNQTDRSKEYIKFINEQMEETNLISIRSSINKGLILGSDEFGTFIEKHTGMRVTPRSPGRPKSI